MDSVKGRRLSEGRPVFWNELYWFGLICLAGWILALAVLAPRLSRNRSTVDHEWELEAAVGQLDKLEREYEAAISAVQNDPFFREEVYRTRLKIKKNNEEFLKETAEVSDN